MELCSEFREVEAGSEYKEDDRMSFENSLILIVVNLRIVFTVLGGRALTDTGSLQRMARWSERPGSITAGSVTMEELLVISKSNICPEECVGTEMCCERSKVSSRVAKAELEWSLRLSICRLKSPKIKKSEGDVAKVL